MNTITVDFKKTTGKVKPMHAVNNGPVGDMRSESNNYDLFRQAHIPYIRNHDASFEMAYGGEHTVDVHRIFEHFDADETKEENYDFRMTDMYMKQIESVGAQCFYRLGSRIEHEIKKAGTLPPKDFHKWARICEHIIRHYTQGWANGFYMNTDYWEIWNEPENSEKNCWGGTAEQFYDLFEITAKHLKKCFPHLKIGGPANAGYEEAWIEKFIAEMHNRDVPLDFYSWHCYAEVPEKVHRKWNTFKKMLTDNGYEKTESILNEWNYVKGWVGKEWDKTLEDERSLKGASFVAAFMCEAHKAGIDMLMYYDARPCNMNGMFEAYTLKPLKGYYPFKMFGDMYVMGTAAETETVGENLYAFAAKSKDSAGVMLTYFSDDERADTQKEVRLDLNGIADDFGVLTADIYVVDEQKNMELMRTERVQNNDFSLYVTMPLHSIYYVKINKQ